MAAGSRAEEVMPEEVRNAVPGTEPTIDGGGPATP
jgi:hypothetical protein